MFNIHSVPGTVIRYRITYMEFYRQDQAGLYHHVLSISCLFRVISLQTEYHITYIIMYFDIGANIGSWSLANINFADKIVAVEADSDTYRTLQSQTEFSDKIIPVNHVVCDDKNDNVDFYKCPSHTLSTLNVEWLSDEKSRFCGHTHEIIKCIPISLDKLIEIHGVPSLIKIDVEGGEFQCIRSLTKKVDCLCFEWASELKDIAFLCIGYLFSLGFTKFYIQNQDTYTFRPTDSDYVTIEEIRVALNKTVLKVDWGMIWCK